METNPIRGLYRSVRVVGGEEEVGEGVMPGVVDDGVGGTVVNRNPVETE